VLRLPPPAFLVLILLSVPTLTRAQQSGDFTYSTNGSAVTITKYTGFGGTVIIPDAINGLPVTAVGTNAFRSCTNVTSVTMGDSVTKIANDAFSYCATLTNVTLGSGLLSIGNSAFYSCTQLGDLALPSNVTSVGSLGFGRCSKLVGITIPASVTNIGGGAFTVCSNLTSIIVDGQNMFYSSANGVLFDKHQSTLLQCPGGIVGSYVIPNTVIRIGNGAFQYCYQLTGVAIPENLTNIAVQALGSCPRLTAIDVDTNNPVFASVAGVLFDRNLTTLIVCPGGTLGSYAIPNSATAIASYGFYQCSGLTNILIPSSVASIGSAAFFGCTSLRSLVLPTSITSIGSSAFGATGLRSLTLPNSVTNVADSLFFSCGQLTNVVIPNSVTSIGSGAFQGCGLTSIIIPDSVRNIGNTAFFALSGLREVFFTGDAPSLGSSVFFGTHNATVYYLPGTTGWSAAFDSCPTALWRPQVQTHDASFGVQTSSFGFSTAWASGRVIVVEASTNLVSSAWTAVATNALIGGPFYFGDPQWTDYPMRFYRIRSP
jgi:hypothetical protein